MMEMPIYGPYGYEKKHWWINITQVKSGYSLDYEDK